MAGQAQWTPFLVTVLLLMLGNLWDECLSVLALRDPDCLRNVSQLIVSKGYPVKEYSVTTEDGYILALQRIPWGRNEPRVSGGKPPVLIVHGLLSSAADWVINYPKDSLGFILADHGFDVWLGNLRGNTYSRRHRTLSIHGRSKFWQFSFHEQGIYDMPAMVDFVLKETGMPKLFYVGHSQGTMVMFVLLSEMPEYNRKIAVFAALAPVTTITHIKSPIRLLAPMCRVSQVTLKILGVGELGKSSRLMKLVRRKACASRYTKAICSNLMFLLFGPETKFMNKTRLYVYLTHDPAGTSVKNVVHFGQMINSKKFRKFDYGPKRNLKLYGQREPPDYPLERIRAPVALFWSPTDWMAPSRDVQTLRKRLRSLVLDYKMPIDDFGHLDFLFGTDVTKVLYAKVVGLFQHYLKAMHSNGRLE